MPLDKENRSDAALSVAKNTNAEETFAAKKAEFVKVCEDLEHSGYRINGLNRCRNMTISAGKDVLKSAVAKN